MRPSRATSELVRLLQDISQPLYLVDDQRRIIFLNDACAKWLAVEAADLLGRECRFQTADPDPLAAGADVLCPPPEVFHGHEIVATLLKRMPEGQCASRRTRFLPLRGETDECIGVLAIMDTADLAPVGCLGSTEGSPQITYDESRRLHEIAARFRAQMALSHHLERLAGSSPAVQRLRRQVEVAAATHGAVLIVGPPGIGRQHVARTIHFTQKARAGTFTPINCAILPADIIYSTISGLLSRHPGGEPDMHITILLIDVHSLPAELHRELTRWINSAPPNVRFMATAPEDLGAFAQRGAFSDVLAQQLSTIVIEMPSLSARRQDIPLVAQMLLEDFNSLGGQQFRGFTPEALDRLATHDWPGQADELATVVREAAAAAEGYEITAADLPKRLRLAADASRHVKKQPEPLDLEKYLASVETEAIRRALADTKGNKARAARLLGLTRPRLYRRMVELGLLECEESVENNEATT
jgi:transcriptional regulator with PAS, ATPase and Fis domain